MSVPATEQRRFVHVGRQFDLEHAGPVIRIWCGACDKHEHLANDDEVTVATAKTSHRCGARTSPWGRGDFGRPA